MFFILAPLPKPEHRVESHASPHVAPYAGSRYYAPVLPWSMALPDMKGLGLSLFGCAPENLANLSPAERAHCTEAFSVAPADSAIPGAVQEHALQSGRWSASIARRNAPLAVPCTSLEQTTVNGIAGAKGAELMIDPHCMLDGLINGFEPER